MQKKLATDLWCLFAVARIRSFFADTSLAQPSLQPL
jgi:hypothetical protein